MHSGDFGTKMHELVKQAKLKSPVCPVHSGDFGPFCLFLWKEILMNNALASDLRLEQLVKLVKTWPEVGSRNILSW